MIPILMALFGENASFTVNNGEVLEWTQARNIRWGEFLINLNESTLNVTDSTSLVFATS